MLQKGNNMSETEKKPEAQGLERIHTLSGLKTFDEADATRKQAPSKAAGATKVKVISRNDGTFDVAWYGKKTVQSKVEEKKKPEEKTHGLKAKDRRRKEKKGRQKVAAVAAARHKAETE